METIKVKTKGLQEIKDASHLEKIISGDKPVLIDFYADWCPPCQALLPVVEDLANEHTADFEIVKVNIDKHPTLGNEYGVKSIPALFFVKDGTVQERLKGYHPKGVLEGKIQFHLR